MNLLVLTTRLFDEPRSGGELCTARLLKTLRDGGHRLTLVGRGDAALAQAWGDTAVSIGDVIGPFAQLKPHHQLAVLCAAHVHRQAITVHRQGGRQAAERHKALLQGPFDACIVDHLQAWPWLGAKPVRPTMLVNHNIESDNYLEMAGSQGASLGGPKPSALMRRAIFKREARCLLDIERQASRQAQVIACLSAEDGRRMASIAAGAGLDIERKLCVLRGYPMGLHQTLRPAPPQAPRRIGLMGTWTWEPNRTALRWFLHRVWPTLQDRCRLVLAGTGLEGLDWPAATQVLGRVDDVRSFYEAVDVVALPSLHGSGVQEKAIEAIGRGSIVVATRHALRGLGPALPPSVHQADTPQAFGALCAGVPLQTPAREAHRRWAADREADYRQVLAWALERLHEPAAGTAPGFAPAQRWCA